MNVKQVSKFAKTAWLMLVFGGVSLYLIINGHLLVEVITMMPLWNLIGCLSLLTLGRYLLVHIQRMSITSFGYPMEQPDMVYVYSVSQLARYLPGGLWHFVGLMGYYNARGVPIKTAGRAVLVEYLWLVVAGGFMGAIFCAMSFANAPSHWVVVLVLCWLLLTFLVNRQIVPHPPVATDLVLVQSLAWAAIGASVWLLIPELMTLDHLVLAIGAFAVSWTLGFVIFFAPGGVGIREPVLVFLLASVVSPEHAAIYATVHRICYVIADLVLFVSVRLNVAETRQVAHTA